MSIFHIGEVLPTRTYIINRAKLVAYANASGDQNPIHQDEEFAKSMKSAKKHFEIANTDNDNANALELTHLIG